MLPLHKIHHYETVSAATCATETRHKGCWNLFWGHAYDYQLSKLHLICRLSQKSLFTSANGQLHCAGSGNVPYKKHFRWHSDLCVMLVGVTSNTFYNGSYCPFTATSCADQITWYPSPRTLHTAMVSTVRSPLGSGRHGQAKLYLFQKHLFCLGVGIHCS